MDDGMVSASASAPASIGNVGVGFDVLGQAFDAARDSVTAVREPEQGVRLGLVLTPDSVWSHVRRSTVGGQDALVRRAFDTLGAHHLEVLVYEDAN